MANTYYSLETKKMATELVILGHESTLETAKKLNIPLKTFEKWITAYNKNNKVFDSDYISPEEQIRSLKKKIAELESINDILGFTSKKINDIFLYFRKFKILFPRSHKFITI